MMLLKAIEWPTVLLLVFVYTAFGLSSYYSNELTLIVSMPIIAMTVTLYSSLQHEVLHGHPFKNQFFSELTVMPSLGLFIPYIRFKETHLQHHYDPNLTDPYDDPETNYLDSIILEEKTGLFKQVLWFNNTLAGRMLIGPIIAFWWFYKDEWRQLKAGNKSIVKAWVLHLIGLAPVIYWIVYFSSMPLWAYFMSVYCGHSILKIRTYLEHRAHERSPARSVIIEDRGLLALLFLNNNFHAVHHAYPKIAWYKLPQLYLAKRREFLKRNSEYIYQSYFEIFKRYFLKAKDGVAHPLWSITNRTKPSK